jgi:hypothetical protein
VTYANRYIDHRDPVLTVSNFANNSSNNLNAIFRNCIFWGENGIVNDEVVVLKNGSTIFNVDFDHNLWKVQTIPSNITSNQISINHLNLTVSIHQEIITIQAGDFITGYPIKVSTHSNH